MTTIIGVLNSQGIAIAADSAVTVNSGDVKKVYNRSNKLFTLSKYNPIGIAIYGNSHFVGIPWETLIKMYRKQLKEKKFDTVEKYKLDFLTFLSKNVGLVAPASKENSFYSFALTGFNELKKNILLTIENSISPTEGMDAPSALGYVSPLISKDLTDYKAYVDTIQKNDLVKFNLSNYAQEYKQPLEDIAKELASEIVKTHENFIFSGADIVVINDIFFNLVKIEHIFEPSSGLVFMGFGEKEIYPSSQLVTVGSIVSNVIRYKIEKPNCISPGTYDADIIPYAQGDVTWTVLNGVDPAYNIEVGKAINEAFVGVASEVELKVPDKVEAKKISDIIKDIPSALVEKLDAYRNEQITRPLVNTLIHMGKEDMAEMAESLVSITSLKRKFTMNSSDESVGGPVDVAIITKGDGFIWLKRKNYFDFNLNRGFIDQYYKS